MQIQYVREDANRALDLPSNEEKRKEELRRLKIRAKILKKTGGFDLPRGFKGKLFETSCKYRPCSGLVTLYARMGLHRYNLLQETCFELIRVKKYAESFSFATCPPSYYITFDAMDPASLVPLTFHTAVCEIRLHRFNLVCHDTRPRGTTKTKVRREPIRDNDMPGLPPENPFENPKRFYLVKDSELESNDWIRLYLELAIAANDQRLAGHDLSNLEIVQVAVETEPPGQGLYAKNATFYIRYIDSCDSRCPENGDRVATVKRIFNESTQSFRLKGEHQSSSALPKNTVSSSSVQD